MLPLTMPAWKYTSLKVEIYRSGEFRLQDLERHKDVLRDQGWEYIDMRALPTSDDLKAEVVLRFRKRREPPAESVR